MINQAPAKISIKRTLLRQGSAQIPAKSLGKTAKGCGGIPCSGRARAWAVPACDPPARRLAFPASPSLSDRGLVAPDGLAYVEALELRMIEVERLVLPRVLVRLPEGIRLSPGLEGSLALPKRMRGVERIVLLLGALEQVKLNEARDLVQMRVATHPDMLEVRLGTLADPEAIHGDEHWSFSLPMHRSHNGRLCAPEDEPLSQIKPCRPRNVPRLAGTALMPRRM